MTHAEFGKLTPAQFRDRLDGHHRCYQAALRRDARLLGYLLAPHYQQGKAPTPEQLDETWTKPPLDTGSPPSLGEILSGESRQAKIFERQWERHQRRLKSVPKRTV
mgnify:CR=1 FL=1